MDCKTARLFLDLAGPRASELEAADAAALEVHLQDCPECGPLALSERHADKRIAAAMRDVPVPADLHARLQTRLAAARGAWYRRRAAGLAAAAAALLVVPLAAWYWLNSHRPVVDVAAVVDQINGLPALSNAQLEQLIHDKYGLKAVLPPNLNKDFLFSVSVEELSGHPVPSLSYVRGSNFAKVLILSGRQFDLPASLRRGSAGSGGITVAIQPHPSADFAYLIEYAGEWPDWLFIREEPGGPGAG
jgi:hypothetical protein